MNEKCEWVKFIIRYLLKNVVGYYYLIKGCYVELIRYWSR